MENLFFIELKCRGCDIFYHSGKKECDFVVHKGTKIVEAYLVTLSMAEQKTQEREINGIKEAMQTFNLSVGYIITMEEKETITTDYGTIHVIPAWEWLLQG